MNSILKLCLALLVTSLTQASAAALDQGTVDRVDDLRKIHATEDKEKIDGFNKMMDAAWKYFSQNKAVSVPTLQQILVEETASKSPNHLVLLDLGHFLVREGGAENMRAAREAFFKIDASVSVIRYNFQDLFHLAYRLAGERDPRMLKTFDRMFLATKGSVFVPQHVMTLDGTLICVFLYGKYGVDSVPHLLERLNEPQHRLRVMEMLVWLGSAEAMPAVLRAMQTNRDDDTFKRAVTYMMTTGGKAGRDAMLALKPDELATESRKYYSEILSAVKETSYARLEKSFASMSGYKPIDDAALRVRLTKMREAYGKDDDLHPLVILKSRLPRDELIRELSASRDRMFYRLSNEALTDVKITNALINTLRFRD